MNDEERQLLAAIARDRFSDYRRMMNFLRGGCAEFLNAFRQIESVTNQAEVAAIAQEAIQSAEKWLLMIGIRDGAADRLSGR